MPCHAEMVLAEKQLSLFTKKEIKIVAQLTKMNFSVYLKLTKIRIVYYDYDMKRFLNFS